MNSYNRFSHITFNIALSCFVLSCLIKYLSFEGSDQIFTIGACGLAFAMFIKSFELPKNNYFIFH